VDYFLLALSPVLFRFLFGRTRLLPGGGCLLLRLLGFTLVLGSSRFRLVSLVSGRLRALGRLHRLLRLGLRTLLDLAQSPVHFLGLPAQLRDLGLHASERTHEEEHQRRHQHHQQPTPDLRSASCPPGFHRGRRFPWYVRI